MREYSILIFTLAGVTACTEQDRPASEAHAAQAKPAAVQVTRKQDAAQLQRGSKLYLQNCTVCHGINAEGSPDWTRPDTSGKYPAPPLNGTGHAWHHPKQALVSTIKHGTQKLGGNMPAWQGKLSDQDIDDIIAWFQSQWPDELYAAWQRTDQQSLQRRR